MSMMTVRTGATRQPLLVVEDNDEDFEALRWALRKIGVDRPVSRCASGDELLDYLNRAAASADRASEAHAPAPPALILLDLNLGADDGRELLAELKADARLRHIPVVVWSTSTHRSDIESCYQRGASGYAAKPVDSDQLLGTLRDLMRYWLDCVILPGPFPPGGGGPGRAPLPA